MRARLALLISLVFTVACGSDFDEKWELKGYRVLGVEASAPEVGPDDTIRLTLHDFDADEAPSAPEYAWSVCFYSLGFITDFECVAPELEQPLPATGPEATLDLGPGGVNLRAMFDAIGPVVLPDGSEATLEGGITLWFFIESGPPDGRQVRTIKRVTVRDSDAPRNNNPGIEAFTLNDADADLEAKVGEDVTLDIQLAADASEPMIGVDGAATKEELLYAFYTTGGELDPAAGYAEDTESTLTLPDEAGDVEIFVTVRDGRGGFAVRRHTIHVTP